ncbi:Putative berberine/berberine, FAD-binding domain, PCMH-type, FAD-binding, type PCMH, subdomain 2 [Colletotrichum destructivum]|uniref:Berberine/berberine, FAD-binding domain, PCMH-type, FAD-binding, type PCMH, subdomain 2 n=1 Tax=Colletotrichum destructivum TaxID=34406 RepID=A0AAX4J3W2_9PEZI|nr:Putative berberine/berberine, FAD-binding domain, PCMH-type, FAD-binding, type PCMH, subdomain 2 [Colletotrichum destructivum]
MRKEFLLHIFAALPALTFGDASFTTAPVGCRKLSTDHDWPAAEVWEAAIPGVIRQNGSDIHGGLPNYRVRAQNISDVQAAVRFASEHNIRLSVITTGHDQLGRSDAGSGLVIDLSLMNKVNVLESFTPTSEGATSPRYPVEAPNTITPRDGIQAAVTFHPGVAGLALNYAVAPSGLFTTSGAAAGVAVAGGWGQNGGYGPLTAQYGLGVDQWLEAKVVTADGQLRVANNVSHQDLFWAIRGGGGGTFGVVVEATWKAHIAVPITGYNWYINSTITGTDALDPETGRTPLSDAMQYLLGELPGLQKLGISAFIYVDISHVRCYAVHPGNASGISKANAAWGPILTKMQSFPNIEPFQTKPYNFDDYKDFFVTTYGPLAETTTNKQPRNHGVFPYDSRLMAPEHLRDPGIMDALGGAEGTYGLLMTAPGQSQGSSADTSANPGWRRAVAHLVASPNADGLRKLAPDMGAYINEASLKEENWTQSFWGVNYPRLSEIKSRYDQGMLFWTTPGINAHYMQSINGRACLVLPPPLVPPATPPASDRAAPADPVADAQFLFGSLELIGAKFPAPGTQIGLQSKPLV